MLLRDDLREDIVLVAAMLERGEVEMARLNLLGLIVKHCLDGEMPSMPSERRTGAFPKLRLLDSGTESRNKVSGVGGL
jgi:hypothetical protein